MDELIKRIIFKLFPELQGGLHVLKFAVVDSIPAEIEAEQESSEFEPRYAVNLQLLDSNKQPDGPIFESVPVPVLTAAGLRGQFAFPQPGTIVGVQFAYGDPERPVITQVYPFGLKLPALGKQDTLMQHSADTFLRSDADENWQLQAKNKVILGNGDVDITQELYKLAAQVEQLSAIQKGHTHNGGPENDAKSSVASVESAAAAIKDRVLIVKQ